MATLALRFQRHERQGNHESGNQVEKNAGRHFDAIHQVKTLDASRTPRSASLLSMIGMEAKDE